MTILRISYKTFLRPTFQELQKRVDITKLFNEDSSYSEYRRRKKEEQLRKVNRAKKEESFDDFLSPEVVEAVQRPDSINKDESNNHLSLQEEREVPIQTSTIKSYKDDLKSLKGSKTDIEKLHTYGYRKYRYVSKEFMRRNNLLAQSDDQEDSSRILNDE